MSHRFLRQVLALCFGACVSFATAADPEAIPRPEQFVDDKHEAIFGNYAKDLEEADSQAGIDRLAASTAFRRSLDRHLLRIVATTGAKRIREIRVAIAGWTDGDRAIEIGADVPPEIKTTVAGYQAQLTNIEQAQTESRAAAGDRLIVTLDDYALGFEKQPDGKKTTIALRADIRKLLARSGPVREWADLEVATRSWKFGDPWFIRMNFHGDELFALSRVTGTFAGGGESFRIGYWDDGLTLGFLGKSMQRDVAAAANSIRHPQLEVKRWTVKIAGVVAWENKVAKLVHKSRGFAYLSGISGSFADDCRLDVSLDPDDGFYYLKVDTGAGNTAGGSAVIVEFPEGETPEFELSSAEWKSGDPTRELIDAKDGICLLTSIAGRIKSRNDVIDLSIGADGKWRLGGRSTKESTRARAMILKFKK